MGMPAVFKKNWKLAKFSSKPFQNASNNANAKPMPAHAGYLMAKDGQAPRLGKK